VAQTGQQPILATTSLRPPTPLGCNSRRLLS
jgi:hypothetical protein